MNGEKSQWQTQLLDQRLKAIEENPDLIKQIDDLIQTLDSETE